MSKVGEGEFYYYLPHKFSENYHICRRDAPHPNFTVIVEQVSLENAKKIVGALNFSEFFKRLKGTTVFGEIHNAHHDHLGIKRDGSP